MPRISETNNIKLLGAGVAAGIIGTLPDFIDNDDGTYDLGEFTVLIYDNDTHMGQLKQYTIAASAGRDLTDTPGQVRYCVVDNALTPGTPQIRDLLLGELAEINESDIIPVYTMLNDNDVHIHVIDWDTLGQGLPNQLHKRTVKTERIAVESGLAISTGAVADHHIEVTAGQVWVGAVEHQLDACDTSSAQGDIVSYDGNSGTGATFSIWGVDDDEGDDFGAIHLDIASGGSGYASDETGVAVVGGSGTGLTIDYHQVAGEIVSATVNNAGINYETTTSLYFYHYTGTGLTVDITVSTGEVTAAVLNAGGTQYFVGDIIAIDDGAGAGAKVRVDTVGASEEVTAITLISGGSGYTVTDTNVPTFEGWIYQRYSDQTGVYPNDGYNTSSGYFPTGSNDWVVAWIYRDLEPEPHFGYVLGEAAYASFAEASASQPRGDLPPEFPIMSTLIGRIICKDGEDVDSDAPNTGIVESAFDITYTGVAVSSHNSLAGLNGGIAGEYYHMDATQYGYVTTPEPEGLGADFLHGIGDVATTLSFDDVTHVFTISGTNWFYSYQGRRVDIPTSATIDLDTAGVGFPATELYFIYFADDSGVLTVTTTPWDLEIHCPVSLVYWNSVTGTGTGAVTDERHGFRRDIQWHLWAHSTLNTRFISGLELTFPSVGTPNQIDIAAGVVADEDIRHAIPNTTNTRIFYETAADVFTFRDDTEPYLDTNSNGNPEWPHTGSSYTPTELTPGFYMPVFCYGTGDEDRPIYISVPSMSASNLYGDVSSAREQLPPTVSFAAEWKLLYRFIYDDSGAFFYDQVQDDFRFAVGSTGGGTLTDISAVATSFAPYSTISSTNVQAAIEELLDEAGGGATLADDTTTNADYYPTMSFTTSGTFSDATISTTKLYFNPSTGTLNSTVFNTLSDASYKVNVAPINNATDIIKQLEGVGFNWKDNGNKSYGVIAQELEKVIPDLVSGDDVKSVNYNGLIAFLINAVKEMSDRIEELENK